MNLAGLSPNGRRRESEGERKSIMCEGRTALVVRCHGRGFVWIESKMYVYIHMKRDSWAYPLEQKRLQMIIKVLVTTPTQRPPSSVFLASFQ